MTRVLTSLIVGVLVFLACPVSGHELQVVTTFSILEDLVQQVGGERVAVNSLIARGADPHTWEPTPREARMVAQADLLVANGGGFDDWLLRLVENAAKQDTPLVMASQGLEAIEHDHDHDHAHHHEGDPHFWLSVPNAIYYVEQITQALTTLSPGDTAYFQERSSKYVRELVELDRWMVEELGAIPEGNRVIVTYHSAFSYLAERYGFTVAEFLVVNPDSEPSPRELARLVDLLKGLSNRSVFTEPQLSSGTRYMQTLAGETGGKLYTLYSDSLSAEIPTYVAMMKYNTLTLLEALK
jgi:ABC-type Zn uptake system ZnuABC Zn-binding protein ZnuA